MGNYSEYLQTNWWKNKSREIRSVINKCELCGSKDKLQVHHLHYRTLYKEQYTDLQVLCDNCHWHEHYDYDKILNDLCLEYVL